MADIDNLTIRINASSQQAVGGINNLILALARLNGQTQANNSNLNVMNAQLKQMLGYMQQLSKQSNNIRNLNRNLRDSGKAGRNAATGIGRFWNMLKRIATMRFVRYVIRSITSAFKEGITNLYRYSDAIDGHFAKSMDNLATSALYLKNGLGTLAAPLIEALAPAIELIIDRFVDAINLFNQFVAALKGESTYTAAKKYAMVWNDESKKASNSVKKSANEIKRTILGFDELNVLQKPKDSSSGSSSSSKKPSLDYSKMFEERNVSTGFKSFSNTLETAISDSLSRIGLIVSGATLAVGAIIALSGNLPLGIGLMAAGIGGVAAVLSWNLMSEEVYGSLKKVIGIASMGSLAIGLILALSGVATKLGIGMIAAGISGIAATVNWQALIPDLYGSMKSINKLISMGSMAVGAILLFAGVNKPLGLGLIAGGIAGAAADMDWSSLNQDLYGSMKGIMKIVSMGAVAIGAILLFTGVKTALGLGLIVGGITGAAVNMDWSSLNVDVYNSMANIYKIATRASFVIGLILALTGVATPLGIGMMAAGAVGTAASLDWDSLKDKVVGKWDEIKKSVLGIWGDIKTNASDMSEWVKDKVTIAWDTISAWTSSKWTSIKVNASTIWKDMKVGASDMSEWVKTNVSNAWNNISSWTSSKWTSIKTTLSTKWEELKTNSSNTFDSVSSSVSNAWNDAKTSLGDFTTWISNTFSSNWNDAWGKVVDFFGNTFSDIKEKAKEPINGVIDFLNSLIGKVERALNRIRRGISNAVVVDIPSYDMPWPIPDTPSIYWKPINLQDVELRRIQPLAKGGILNRTTLLGFNGASPVIGGEAGREAVLPLDQNTEWMNNLSDRILSRANNSYGGNSGGAFSDNGAVVRLLQEVRGLLERINEKEFISEITTSSINNAQRRTNRRAGLSITPVAAD